MATWAWAAVFGVRAVLQWILYQNDEVGWLGTARVAMGWPLALVGFAVTVWAVRSATRQYEAEELGEEPGTGASDEASGQDPVGR